MAKVIWAPSNRFEYGIDQVVMYPQDKKAVAWNGVTKITETNVREEISPHYFDGLKYVDTVNKPTFQLTLTSLSEPLEFLEALGYQSVVPGFFLTKQQKKPFGLSYRTRIGTDLGHRIHLVYNVLAKIPSEKYNTLTNSVNASVHTWTLLPSVLEYPELAPSAHFVFDSTKMSHDSLTYLQNLIYGTTAQDPRLPTVNELVTSFS